MGFRFRRSIKLMPGVRVNLSKSGVSTSLGGPGATLNLGRRGARSTVGIPGTGLSYSSRVSGASPAPDEADTASLEDQAERDDAAAHGIISYRFTTPKGIEVTLQQVGGVIKAYIAEAGTDIHLRVQSVHAEPEAGHYLLLNTGAKVICSEADAAHVDELMKVAAVRRNYMISRSAEKVFAVIWQIVKVLGVVIMGVLGVVAAIFIAILAGSGAGRRR